MATAPGGRAVPRVELDPFLTWLLARGGVDGDAYRPAAMQRRLGACLRQLRVNSTGAARELIERHESAVESSEVYLAVAESHAAAQPAAADDGVLEVEVVAVVVPPSIEVGEAGGAHLFAHGARGEPLGLLAEQDGPRHRPRLRAHQIEQQLWRVLQLPEDATPPFYTSGSGPFILEGSLFAINDEDLFEYYMTSQLALVNPSTLQRTPLGKPALVGGIGPRGVVSTASYEARA